MWKKTRTMAVVKEVVYDRVPPFECNKLIRRIVESRLDIFIASKNWSVLCFFFEIFGIFIMQFNNVDCIVTFNKHLVYCVEGIWFIIRKIHT